jgi:hypothetical protein
VIPGSARFGRFAAAGATAAALLGCGAASESTPTVAPAVRADGVQQIAVTFGGGQVDGGVVRYAVPRGAPVEVMVFSDVADLVHLHRYERFSYVTAGASTTVRFVADLPGLVDVELEQRGVLLTQLQIS